MDSVISSIVVICIKGASKSALILYLYQPKLSVNVYNNIGLMLNVMKRGPITDNQRTNMLISN